MKKRLLLEIIIGLLLIIISASIGYALGSSKEADTSFYCTITSLSSNTLEVSGIPENDVNHRGNFVLAVNAQTKITNLSDEKLSITDLKIGSLIKVTYSGEVLETYPAKISDPHEIIIIQ